ncbi:hypothetical protein BS47DRAFT_1403406 [Hydnum rufescens UP504]|uniref:Uncharacterized protein n=1 Tax=Hydnum rufescens UP504 TaxID=1448309 RepID=A0A9P6ACH3_9AGAM|nr:hypothetical protein BS47DRAFT_1403406 [Hydnum rufescens UP504]
MPSLSIPTTISTFLAPPPSLTKLSLNEWYPLRDQALDPRKKDSFMYKDEQMPFGGATRIHSVIRFLPRVRISSSCYPFDHSFFSDPGFTRSSSFSLDPPHSRKNSKPHKKPSKIKLSSYRAYPALRQAMEAREANHRNHVESIRVNYYDKRKSDVEDITKILSLLHRTLDSREFEITAMIDAAAALTCQTHSLDEQR